MPRSRQGGYEATGHGEDMTPPPDTPAPGGFDPGRPFVLPPNPPPDPFHARCVALEAASRVNQRDGNYPASSDTVTNTAQKFFEWLMEGDDA